jgi:hypothetical protein
VWNSTAVRVGTLSNEDAGAALTRCYHAGNWLLLALFALALASAGMSVRLFIVPCDKKTSYETTNTTMIVNVTSYFNQTRLENITVTETVMQLENITTKENVTYDVYASRVLTRRWRGGRPPRHRAES